MSLSPLTQPHPPLAASRPIGIDEEPPRVELNGPAPDFEANSTQGSIRLSTWSPGKWVVLFSHPADFTPVCTTEFVEFAKRADALAQRHAVLLGSSVDSVSSHIAWLRNIEEKFGVRVPFPVLADIDQKVARLYGMVHAPSSTTAAVRCVYFIDPKRVVRAMIYYPLNVGRNADEIVRVVDALHTVDAYGVSCPANWMPGQDVIMPPPATLDAAEERLKAQGEHSADWYLTRRKLA